MKYLCHDNLEAINKIIQNLRKVFHVHACFLHSNSFNASFWVKICILQLFTFNFSTPPNYRPLNFVLTKNSMNSNVLLSPVSFLLILNLLETLSILFPMLSVLKILLKAVFSEISLKEIGGDSCFISWLTFCARYGI